jgi:hypothetical protein
MINASYFHSCANFSTSINRSSLNVQQTHPLSISTSFSSVCDRLFPFFTRFASIFTSHISFTIKATFLSPLWLKILFKRVVFHAHKNQERTVTGIFFII